MAVILSISQNQRKPSNKQRQGGRKSETPPTFCSRPIATDTLQPCGVVPEFVTHIRHSFGHTNLGGRTRWEIISTRI